VSTGLIVVCPRQSVATHVDKDVDDVIVESHGAKDVRLVHLIFSVLASNDQPCVVRQIEREKRQAPATVYSILLYGKSCG
jgi:hypothetical protein